MQKPAYLPQADRLSILSASILLAYASLRFINIPPTHLELQLPGFLFSYEIGIRTIVTVIVAGLTATGADLMMRDHPGMKNQRKIEHWLLPALTAWVIGVPLYQLPLGVQWLASFVIGGIILMLVLVAEYIAVDPDDIHQPIASAGLTAVSFALFLLLIITLRIAGVRLFQLLPAVAIATILIGLRTLHLRLHGRWVILPVIALALIAVQIATALHYWPISPISYSLAVLGPVYALTIFIGAIAEDMPTRRTFIEPGIILLVFWVAAIWLSI